MKTRNLLYLSRQDVESLGISMATIIEVVEHAFVEKGCGRVEMPPKPGIHPRPDAFIHAMPALIPRLGAAGIKWISGFPQNVAKRLPYISGLLILNDPQTGIPVSVMDATWITAQRTGAASAVAAKYLARPDARTVAIIACGVQGRSNWEALKTVLPKLDRIQAYDLHASRTRRFCAAVSGRWGIDAVPCPDPRAACCGADIVVTSGPIRKRPSPVIARSWLKEGVFLSPVDFDSYVKPAVFEAAGKFYTDDLAQQQYYKASGYFRNIRDPQGDLGELVTGRKKGRTNRQEITIALNLGLALEDLATAILIDRTARRKGVGRRLPL